MSLNTATPTPQSPALRWGFVGTGKIAGWMAAVLRDMPGAQLAAVASRSAVSAQAFASRHSAERGFAFWAEMLAWDGIDAVYVATPTARREEICIAAAQAGKHVLGEKPFTSLPSLKRITAACREHGVAFMDATHFVHHPRTAAILERRDELVGRPSALDSSFLVPLGDRSDIRYDRSLEPLGALGDLGWYTLRATLEYLSPLAALRSINARLRRDRHSGAIIGGAGSLVFEDGRVSTWRCGFDAETPIIKLRLSGPLGQIAMDNFVGDEADGSASYRPARASGTAAAPSLIRVGSHYPSPALMFQDFAVAARDPMLRDRWIEASERTQGLLDAVQDAAEG